MHALERDVFGCNIPSSYGADWGNPQYEKLLREALQEIASQIQNNLEEAQRNNWYMRDENSGAYAARAIRVWKSAESARFPTPELSTSSRVRGRRQL